MNDGLSSKQRIEFGLDTIPEDRTVEVPLRELMRIHETLNELVGFFHHPENFPDIGTMIRFMGNDEYDGAFQEISSRYYNTMLPMVPQDIQDRIEDFDPGGSPNYDNS